MRYIHSEETLQIPENGEIIPSYELFGCLVAEGLEDADLKDDREEGAGCWFASLLDEKMRELVEKRLGYGGFADGIC